jgi:hypothetical protein
VAAIEAFRVKAGAAPVSYLVADVDNRKGAELVNMYMVSAFNDEGRQFTFSRVSDVIDSWGPNYTSDYKWTMPDGRVLEEAVGDELNAESGELQNAHLNDADVAERTTMILASNDAELPPEFTRVAVRPLGIMAEEQEAQPAP